MTQEEEGDVNLRLSETAKKEDHESQGSRKSSRIEDELKPISSEEEDDNDVPGQTPGSRTLSTAPPACTSSRFFSPYRTLGIVSSGSPFFLVPHDHSGNAMVALPIGDRFQFMRTDHLRPSLVSQSVPSSLTGGKHKRSGRQEISHMVTDATLSISVVAHGRRPGGSKSTFLDSSYYADRISLFSRTQPLDTKSLLGNRKDWCIQDLVHLGRVKQRMSGEKEGKLENVAVVAVILGRLDSAQETMQSVPVVGDDDDDDNSTEEGGSDSSESEGDDDSSSSEDDDDDPQCHCEVVVVVASRNDMTIQNRIPLSSAPNFSPLVAVHPSTYLNKIVVAGYDTVKRRAAMILLNIRSGKIIHTFQCLNSSSKDGSRITTLAQSPAVDTVAVGTNHGIVHLVNLRHDKKLFSLEHKTKKSNKPTQITSVSFRTDASALQYSTAPMAVGRQDGTITIWDLTPPEDPSMDRSILHEMQNVHPPGGISKLQFLPQEPLLLSTGTQSNAIIMHIFDNPDHSGRILRMRKGHTAPPRFIQYLHPGTGAGGGILANASDGTDAAACQILSGGGRDRTLRVFSTARTVSDKEYGQGRGLVKKAKRLGMESTTDLLLPPLTSMATSEARSRDWGDLVTIHENHSFAYVWNTRRGAQSGPVLRQEKWNVSTMKVPPPSHTHATSVAISACGNFALVGSRGGRVYKYNIQSGIPRGSYPKHGDEEAERKKNRSFVPGDVGRAVKALDKSKKLTSRPSNLDKMELDAEQRKKQEKRLQKKLNDASHLGFAVSGLAVDAINKTLISVGMDGKLILWNLVTHLPHKKSPFNLASPATKLRLVRDSGLAAIALKDFSVLVFDTLTQSIIRRFGIEGSQSAHQGPISDVGFSPDGRSLYTASMDSTLRVWDVPTDSCVDWLRFKTPPTSIAVSPTGEFIATVHTGSIGLSVWCDRSFYEIVYTEGEPPKEAAHMDEPTPLADQWDASHSDGRVAHVRPIQTREESAVTESSGPPQAKHEGIVTLSGLAPSHWKNLFSLELVKQRNKPKEAPKKPPSAPFFLQWRAGEAVVPGEDTKSQDEEGGESKSEDWAGVWSDDDGDGDAGNNASITEAQLSELVREDKRRIGSDENDDKPPSQKRRKTVRHARSHLSSLLLTCSDEQKESPEEQKRKYSRVSEYIATLGPSAIDVALSTLCHGQHDLEEGLPLLILAAEWLLEETRTRERFEAVNAYLHRFLHLHASIVAGVDDSPGPRSDSEDGSNVHEHSEQLKQLRMVVSELRGQQSESTIALRNKMQKATCMLRHLSRMV